MRTPKLCLTSLVLLGVAVHGHDTNDAQAQNDEKQAIGVSVAVAVNVTKLESDLLSEELGRALSEKFDVVVIAGEAARAKLPPDGLPDSCIAETECLGQAAAALGVDRLLLFVAIRTGSDIQVDATLYDAKTKALEKRPTVRMVDKRSEWKIAFASNAESLLPGAPLRDESSGTGTGTGTGTGIGSGGAGNGSGTPGQDGGGSNLHWYVLGGGALAIGAGAVVGLTALNKCGDDKEDCASGTKRRARIADGLYVTGGVVTAIGLYLLFTRDTSSKSEQSAFQVGPGPGDLGLAVGGSF